MICTLMRRPEGKRRFFYVLFQNTNSLHELLFVSVLAMALENLALHAVLVSFECCTGDLRCIVPSVAFSFSTILLKYEVFGGAKYLPSNVCLYRNAIDSDLYYPSSLGLKDSWVSDPHSVADHKLSCCTWSLCIFVTSTAQIA
jgi:hypothetical protein